VGAARGQPVRRRCSQQHGERGERGRGQRATEAPALARLSRVAAFDADLLALVLGRSTRAAGARGRRGWGRGRGCGGLRHWRSVYEHRRALSASLFEDKALRKYGRAPNAQGS
jgi:hypothetical protein